jgi:hypothetical protein
MMDGALCVERFSLGKEVPGMRRKLAGRRHLRWDSETHAVWALVQRMTFEAARPRFLVNSTSKPPDVRFKDDTGDQEWIEKFEDVESRASWARAEHSLWLVGVRKTDKRLPACAILSSWTNEWTLAPGRI